ncbi:LPXTG cell wall anchor domain-containing protein, partial [Streptococcus mitis]|uniref:LPXTG cell wall anchor domain-containing protein n=1 Tax=Streptococcus mitis TaxID=28037 RepID=UPI0021B754AD
ISHDIPGTDLVNQDFTPVKPDEKVPEYTNPVGTSSTDGEGNVITPPTVEIPAYTDPVTPITPDTNGGSGQDTPAPTPATPTPNSVTPNADQVDTKTTVDNGAKSNDSQNVLPNTGTESNATLASLGLLGLLSGFGLVARKKKED